MPDKPLLVVRDADGDRPLPVASNDGELEFHLSGTNVLYLGGGVDSLDTLDFLTYRVARCPRDLATHVRRVFLCARLNLKESLYGALLDLFIVLTDQGRCLRRRLLYGAKAYLEIERFAALERCLGSDTDGFDDLPLTRNSMLSGGNIAPIRPVVTTETSRDSDHDPLTIARTHVEFSQLTEARLTLEEALLSDPLRKELQLELLELYRSTRDKEHFLSMFGQIAVAKSPVPEAWNETMQFFQVPPHDQ